MSDPLIPVPPSAPRTGNAFGRWLGRTVLRAGGWKLAGAFPDRAHLVVIAAPHSSNWDAVWGIAAKLALGLEVRFLAKQELFVGPLGWLLRRLGGIGIDRRRSEGVVAQAADLFAGGEQLWLAIAPEGTRKPVRRWKSGFWRIARAAGVPVLCAGFDYPTRSIRIGPLLEASDDYAADLARFAEVYRGYRGRNRGVSGIDAGQ